MKLRYPQVFLFLCTFCVMPTIFAAAVNLDTPVGGWRTGAVEGEGENFRQTVNYPASSVNTPAGQANTARISGQIKSTPKSKEPGRLIVNGVSMPLKIDPAGRFDRPFSFPNGSNSVEVRSPDGQQRHRTQFLNASGGATPAKSVDFASVLAASIGRVDQAQRSAGALAEQFQLGARNVSLEDTMVALQKANISFQAMVQVRNKVAAAYTEIMNMQI